MKKARRKPEFIKGIPRREWFSQIGKRPRPGLKKKREFLIAKAANMRARQLAKNGGKLFGTGVHSQQVQAPPPVTLASVEKFNGLTGFRQAVDDYV